MKNLIAISLTLATINTYSQDSYTDLIEANRIKKQTILLDTAKRILTIQDLEHFDSLNYFEIDTNFILSAKWKKSKGRKFKMPTSTDRQPIYRRFGYLYFDINHVQCTLTVYQNMELKNKPEFKNYLFIPFRDKTSGNESYGGGRYLDFYLPKKQSIVEIDFNLCYNPYCAYSYRYSCPIPPKENTLLISIEAGEKTPSYHD